MMTTTVLPVALALAVLASPSPAAAQPARNPAGQEIYSWTMQPERKVLEPGETMSFRSRLVSPPKDVRDVLVRFFTTADATGAK